jgi:hypothetical protein
MPARCKFWIKKVLFYEQEMQPDFVFELMSFKIREDTGFLERGQVQDDFKDGSAFFALNVSSPDLRQDHGSYGDTPCVRCTTMMARGSSSTLIWVLR